MAKVADKPFVFPKPFLVFFVFSIISGFGITLSEAGFPKIRHYKWEVEYMFWSPDCVENIVMGINGQFPGPMIRANAGDIVVVELTNKLHTEGVVIHWHGILQRGTPWADGTASISQCAINPGETFTYRFVVDKVRGFKMSMLMETIEAFFIKFIHMFFFFFFFCRLGHISIMVILGCKDQQGCMDL